MLRCLPLHSSVAVESGVNAVNVEMFGVFLHGGLVVLIEHSWQRSAQFWASSLDETANGTFDDVADVDQARGMKHRVG